LRAINDARYVELGAYQKGDETWIVLARRQPEARCWTRPAAHRVLALSTTRAASPASAAATTSLPPRR